MDRKIESSGLKKHAKKVAMSVIALSVAAAYRFSQSSSQDWSQTVNASNLTVSTVNQGEFVDALSLRGQVVPKTTIYLDTISGGQVEERLVEREFVKKGQPLVRLSNTICNLM